MGLIFDFWKWSSSFPFRNAYINNNYAKVIELIYAIGQSLHDKFSCTVKKIIYEFLIQLIFDFS